MTAVRILLEDEMAGASLSVGQGTGLYQDTPVENISFLSNARIARFSTPQESVILGQWDQAKPLSSLVLWRHNLTSLGKIRLEIFSGPNQTGFLLYDSGEIPALDAKLLQDIEWGVEPLSSTVFTNWVLRYSVLWFPRVLGVSFRITLKDSTVSHIDLARVYLGRYFEPDLNFSYGHSLKWVDESPQYKTADGSIYSENWEPKREFSFSLDWLSETDRPIFFDALRRVGRRRDFFISAFPEAGGSKERDYSFAAKFLTVPGVVGNFENNYTAQGICKEC